MEKFIKTPAQVAQQLEHWYHMYHPTEKEADRFVLFNKLPVELMESLTTTLALPVHEIAVLVLMVSDDAYIVNTTERFIRVSGGETESLPYSEFDSHRGFLVISGIEEEAKLPGRTGEFEMKKTNGESIFWPAPMGRPGFKFWNVTKRCEIIGRKYLIHH